MMDNSFDSENLSGESFEDDRETKNQTDKEKVKNKIYEEREEPEIKNLNLIKSISNTLITILEGNKKLEKYKDIIKKQSKMAFSTNSIPRISLEDYLIRIQTYSGIENNTLILALILIDHICKKTNLILTYYNIHRVLFGSILISIKYNEDTYYDNKFYAEIGGVDFKELKIIEYSILELNDFNVFVNNREFEKYRKSLEDFNHNSQ